MSPSETLIPVAKLAALVDRATRAVQRHPGSYAGPVDSRCGFEIAQIKARDIAANARAIGIRPTGDHASTSVPGTSRATALRSSVASLR